jgi:CIC family chloride channel protein
MKRADSSTGKTRFFSLAVFSLLSVAVGILSGFGAVAFRMLIALAHNLFFLGKISTSYPATEHTSASPWGPLVVLVPVAGALLVVFLVKTFAAEAGGTGVPEVIDAVYYSRGVIRPVVAVIKSLASSLSIGSGGSLGREGPIVLIGSSLGSTLGQILPLKSGQRTTLMAAGAGAGIAATFNTPVGGVLFAVEIILQEVSVRTVVPVILSAVTATYVARLFFGVGPAFFLPAVARPYFSLNTLSVPLAYAGVGLLMGLASTLFIKSVYTFEDFFSARFKRSPYLRHATGMVLLGGMMVLMKAGFGHYYIEGLGYATVADVLTGKLALPGLLVLIFALKLAATSLTLGSGGSGGIFSPCLAMGATLGGAYGTLLLWLFPGFPVSPAALAVAGMAGLVGGAMGAALTAVVMISEMTLDYGFVLPMAVTVALSYGVRKLMFGESIYTMRLRRRGHFVPQALEASILRTRRAREFMDKLPSVSPADTWATVASSLPAGAPMLMVREGGKILGLVSTASAAASPPGRALAGLASRDFVVVGEMDSLQDVVARMIGTTAASALVAAEARATSAEQVRGIITRERLSDFFEELREVFPPLEA